MQPSSHSTTTNYYPNLTTITVLRTRGRQRQQHPKKENKQEKAIQEAQVSKEYATVFLLLLSLALVLGSFLFAYYILRQARPYPFYGSSSLLSSPLLSSPSVLRSRFTISLSLSVFMYLCCGSHYPMFIMYGVHPTPLAHMDSPHAVVMYSTEYNT